MTYAEGLYRRRHKKQVESTEDYLHRVTEVPYIQVGTKYIINYSLFLQRLNEKGD